MSNFPGLPDFQSGHAAHKPYTLKDRGGKANGQLRICLDPKDLNKAIRRDYHVTTTLEEILPKFNGAKFFSILDAKSGYWNVELDEPSSYLTTFNSPFGRYQCLRMPIGIRMAQDVFQHRIDQLTEGCPEVTGIADDIVVFEGFY